MGRRDAGKKARVCSEGTALKRQKGKEESVVVEARARESRAYDESRKDQSKSSDLRRRVDGEEGMKWQTRGENERSDAAEWGTAADAKRAERREDRVAAFGGVSTVQPGDSRCAMPGAERRAERRVKPCE